MTRSMHLLLWISVALLALGAALLLVRLTHEKTPRGEGLYSVKLTNYFPSPTGQAPYHTRFYPIDLSGTSRQKPADREIWRPTVSQKGVRA